MRNILSASAALQKLRSAVLPPLANDVPAEEPLGGASFLGQEPDLAKEAGVTTLEISGWAAGGQPSAE